MIAGTMNTQRLREIAAGSDIPLNCEDWYRIYSSKGRELLLRQFDPCLTRGGLAFMGINYA